MRSCPRVPGNSHRFLSCRPDASGLSQSPAVRRRRPRRRGHRGSLPTCLRWLHDRFPLLEFLPASDCGSCHWSTPAISGNSAMSDNTHRRPGPKLSVRSRGSAPRIRQLSEKRCRRGMGDRRRWNSFVTSKMQRCWWTRLHCPLDAVSSVGQRSHPTSCKLTRRNPRPPPRRLPMPIWPGSHRVGMSSPVVTSLRKRLRWETSRPMS